MLRSLSSQISFPQHLPLIAHDSWALISTAMMKNPSTGTPLTAIFFLGALLGVSRAREWGRTDKNKRKENVGCNRVWPLKCKSITHWPIRKIFWDDASVARGRVLAKGPGHKILRSLDKEVKFLIKQTGQQRQQIKYLRLLVNHGQTL